MKKAFRYAPFTFLGFAFVIYGVYLFSLVQSSPPKDPNLIVALYSLTIALLATGITLLPIYFSERDHEIRFDKMERKINQLAKGMGIASGEVKERKRVLNDTLLYIGVISFGVALGYGIVGGFLFHIDVTGGIALGLGALAVFVALWSHGHLKTRLQGVEEQEIYQKIAMIYGYAHMLWTPIRITNNAISAPAWDCLTAKIVSDLRAMMSIREEINQKWREDIIEAESVLINEMKKRNLETTRVEGAFTVMLYSRP